MKEENKKKGYKIMKTFKFEDKYVKVEIIDNAIWFVADDVADILGFGEFTIKAIKDHVDKEDYRIYDGVYVVNESGLYNLIFASKLIISMKFKKWILSEVLSKFRNYGNNGTYEKNQMNGLISDYYDHYLKYLEKSIDEKNKLINESYEIIKRIKNTH